MTILALIVAAVALSLERICYVWVWRRPDSFRAFCARWARTPLADPVRTLFAAFLVFKSVQLAVFLAWCAAFGSLWPQTLSVAQVWCGLALMSGGQLLNFGVFRRLGTVGVFYGNRFGHHIPWQRGFPFSIVRHPQYVGTVLTIWGFFIVMRYPGQDWYALPTLETLFYAIGAAVEH